MRRTALSYDLLYFCLPAGRFTEVYVIVILQKWSFWHVLTRLSNEYFWCYGNWSHICKWLMPFTTSWYLCLQSVYYIFSFSSGKLHSKWQASEMTRPVHILQLQYLIYWRWHQYMLCISVECYWQVIDFIIFTNPSARAGYDTRSIFKRSLTGLNSEFSFS